MNEKLEKVDYQSLLFDENEEDETIDSEKTSYSVNFSIFVKNTSKISYQNVVESEEESAKTQEIFCTSGTSGLQLMDVGPIFNVNDMVCVVLFKLHIILYTKYFPFSASCRIREFVILVKFIDSGN